MSKYNSQEEIEKDWDLKDYQYCINNIYQALKKLKFDVIKDKGQPIAEDVYIELWFDEGKIENWTN